MVSLSRFAYASFGTYGRLMLEECDIVFYTVELPWRSNLPKISCIPEGIYRFCREEFTREDGTKYETYQVLDIPGRSRIFLHIANWPGELKGCIGIGLYPSADERNHVWGVSQSTLAHAEFMAAMGDVKETKICVKGYHHVP
jgi:hypothetical protein